MDGCRILLEALQAPHPRARLAALRLLGEYADRSDPRLPPALDRAVQDPHWPVRVAAREAAERLAVRLPEDTKNLAPLQAQPAARAAADSPRELRALVRFGECALRCWSCDALCHRAGESGAALLQNLLMDGIPEVRASLFAVLITSTAPFATDFIQETRQDSDPQLCRLVVEALLERPSPQGYSLLREELCHSDTARSAAAVQSLLRHPAEPHHALLQECLAAREPAELPGIFLPPEPADSRHIALQWLAACLSAPAQALLRQSLQHPDPTLRRLAVEALQEHPSRPGYVLLKERAPDKRGLFAGKPVLEPDRALRAAIGVAKEAIRIALEKTAGLPSAASATPITLDALPRIVPRAESEE